MALRRAGSHSHKQQSPAPPQAAESANTQTESANTHTGDASKRRPERAVRHRTSRGDGVAGREATKLGPGIKLKKG